MSNNDEDGNGTLSRKELMTFLVKLGYLPTQVVIRETIEHSGLPHDMQDFGLGEIFQILELFRYREGMSADEGTQLKESFDLEDTEGTGDISLSGFDRVLRKLG